MKIRLRLPLSLGAAAAAAGVLAFAGFAGPTAAANDKVDNVFKVWDRDGDGVLTTAEVPDATVFQRIDGDGDGKVTRAEVAAYFGVAVPDGAGKAGKPQQAQKPAAKKSEAAPVPDPRTIKERVEDFFRRFDKNRDGDIAKDEFQAGDEVFDKYDRGNNGKWSRREVTRYIRDLIREAKKRPNRNNFFDLFDMNRDKKVTKREYDGPPQFFRDHDHDKDRVVTEGELALGPNGGDADREMMKRDRAVMADGPTTLPRRNLLERFDEDGDGRVTLEELGGAATILERLDKNGDGVLSGSETR